ncbi:Restriction endonuclease [Caulifigura coniformis]|uniref:Restriction endonuclease n=1 Tax=Caulifigura coniformis TaxID=2527983 RepID=A0A517SHI4_9PLAN|nr:restriction endonuclease [Caulifigura coniformis]QDT55584.1 Restriction endonuclease [Caulifigura coniformis]
MHVTRVRQYFLDTIVELTGIKAGVGVTVPKAVSLLKKRTESNVTPWWSGDPLDVIRLEGGEVESGLVLLLHRVGAISEPLDSIGLLIRFVRAHLHRLGKVEDEPDFRLPTGYLAVQDLSALLNGMSEEPTEHVRGLTLLPEWQDIKRAFAIRNVMDRLPTSKSWNGIVQLDDLFESEAAPADPETYFDQRFIDYLNAQGEDLNRIHWRQFEYLVAEYYKRLGYRIKIGPGRGDDGVDIILEKDRVFAGPEVILIQCKRYSGTNEVKINEVKALWADVNVRAAASGLIATTTRLARNSREYCDARHHRLKRAERENIVQMLREMADVMSSPSGGAR